MKHYLINIHFYDPYPVQEAYNIEASSGSRACYLAWKQLQATKRKRKKEPVDITFKVTRI